MTTQEFEKAFVEANGYPAWSQFVREGKEAGKSDRQIADEYSAISVNKLVAMGGRPNKATK